jgi:hypothetical protein
MLPCPSPAKTSNVWPAPLSAGSLHDSPAAGNSRRRRLRATLLARAAVMGVSYGSEHGPGPLRIDAWAEEPRGTIAVQEQDQRSAGEDSGKPVSAPPPDEVRAQLARILASREFVVPGRARNFLRYLVEQTLAGRADRLKGYTIGTAVFERDESFDAQADPVVRTEAGRLRRALERYYLVAGKADPVLIDVPKGCYVPTFAHRVLPSPEPPVAEGQPATSSTSKSAGPVRWRAAAVAMAGLAILAVALSLRYPRLPPQPAAIAEAALPDGPILLVMPFESLSGGRKPSFMPRA